MPFHGTCPKKGVVCNDFLLPFYLKLLNQSEKDNGGENKCYMSIVALDHKWEDPHCSQQKKPKEQTYDYNWPKISLLIVKILKILLNLYPY
jgi:hypothetical protein